MSRDNLKGLMIERLRDLYQAEHLLVKALPPMARAATAPELRNVLERHVVQTVNQSQRLDKIFRRLSVDPRGRRCRGMEGILAEAYEILEPYSPRSVTDAALIAAAQRIEHYEIAAYECVRRYALLLGRPDIADFVQQSLEEEEDANRQLAAVAEHEIDFRALADAGAEAIERAS
jgi:ferritin-like metal-binding protein YciE